MKQCTKCKKLLSLDQFCKRKTSKDGLAYWCKNCCKKYNQENATQVKVQQKEYKQKNLEKVQKINREWCKNNSKRIKRYSKKWSKNNPEKLIWYGMKQRCINPKNISYKNYGGRGIEVCNRWLNSFKDFFRDMGKRPSSKHTIDRINNDGHYESGNCRWTTRKQQNNNRRKFKVKD